MVSSPSFDRKILRILGKYREVRGVYVNRLFSSVYPGSVFKLVTAAAAIDNMDDTAVASTARSINATKAEYWRVLVAEAHGSVTLDRRWPIRAMSLLH